MWKFAILIILGLGNCAWNSKILSFVIAYGYYRGIGGKNQAKARGQKGYYSGG